MSIENAPIQSLRNRKTLEQHSQCGCYACLKVFETKLITKWTDQNQTALCPFCECDCIVLETKPEILKSINYYWI
jgi:hypothetical protein